MYFICVVVDKYYDVRVGWPVSSRVPSGGYDGVRRQIDGDDVDDEMTQPINASYQTQSDLNSQKPDKL